MPGETFGKGTVTDHPVPVIRIVREAELESEDAHLRLSLDKANARAAEAERRLTEAAWRCADLQHQLNNLLAVVRSVARRSAETSESVEEYAMHLDGRLSALGRVQGAIAADPGLRLDLHSLISDELLSFQAKEGEQLQLSGPQIVLQPRAAGTLGLAFHELATNTVKFGALTRPEGRIAVSWRLEAGPEPRLVIDWAERGGPPAVPPARKGFGLTLFERMLPYELKAECALRFERGGVRCRIELPLTQQVGAAPHA
ncbi:sensor histidine kinase [Methylobacterium durans]|uniref:sensor histidine kinase n=1 Tax=Methylobacterium durans TaxID=2202825 RepID=UPI002AFE1284|nr:sensor histidine kinase [Methylobacterium durans]MEA1834362.1 sensor histidine kinase [Methylobacterium durans]